MSFLRYMGSVFAWRASSKARCDPCRSLAGKWFSSLHSTLGLGKSYALAQHHSVRWGPMFILARHTTSPPQLFHKQHPGLPNWYRNRALRCNCLCLYMVWWPAQDFLNSLRRKDYVGFLMALLKHMRKHPLSSERLGSPCFLLPGEKWPVSVWPGHYAGCFLYTALINKKTDPRAVIQGKGQ